MHARYLVLTELFLPTKGGTAVWFDAVYRRLGGKDTHILTADVPGSREHDQDHPNSIHRLHLNRVSWLRPESLLIYLRFLAASVWLAFSRAFTAIHAGRALPEGLVGWLVARLTGRPIVVYAHGEELTGWGRGRKYEAMRFVLTRADRVIANSEFTRDILIAMGVAPERIVIINPGVDTTRFRPGLLSQDLRVRLGLSSEAKLLLSVGRLQRRKGFDMVVRCLSSLLDDGLDVHYAIVGIGEDREYLLNLAQLSGVGDRVHLLGHIPSADLPRWYNACDLFVLPNRDIEGDTEGFGIVFVEAAACGKTAVAGCAGGTGSAVIDGVTGLRVDGESQQELTGALLEILRDDERRQSLGAAGLLRAHDLLSWDAVAARTVELAEAREIK
jgi:phosphatidyl-myo-inositol dimannoside synthase